MIKKITAIIWLRTQLILVNKVLLLQMAIPFILAVLFDQFMNNDASVSGLMILNMCLTMAFLFAAGQPLTTAIAEEKEKNNLQSMKLAGVTSKEYIGGSLFFPIFLSLASMAIMPLMLQVSIKDFLLPYIVVGCLTALSIVLVHLVIGLYCETQAQAQALSFPLILVIQFLPMFAETNTTLDKIANFSFMRSYSTFFEAPTTYSLHSTSFYVLIVWIITLIVLNLYLLKGKKYKQESVVKHVTRKLSRV